MGARMMRSFIEQPLINKEEINERLDAVAELNKNAISREEIREYLNPVYDLERLISKISYQSANPRDLLSFKSSLSMLPHIKYLLQGMSSKALKEAGENLDTLEDLYDLVDRSIVEEPPIAIREGGIIKEGFHEEINRQNTPRQRGKHGLFVRDERKRKDRN